MAEVGWSPWKLTAVGATVAVVTALATSLIGGFGIGKPTSQTLAPRAANGLTVRGPATPSQWDVEACNDYARSLAGDRGGDSRSARPRANGEKDNETRYAEAYQACMKGRGFGGV